MDVLVVGAGPAGATAARTLALGGARGRIVDRYRFPRNKPCGGAISMRALRRFPYLSSALKRISTRLISRLRLQSPAGESVDLQSDTPAALMIRRVEFDELLVRLAQEAGAELTEDVEIVQVERSRSRKAWSRRRAIPDWTHGTIRSPTAPDLLQVGLRAADGSELEGLLS